MQKEKTFSMNIQHYKREQITKLDRHVHRKNKNYSNECIDLDKSKDNIELVSCSSLLGYLDDVIKREVKMYGNRVTANSVYCTEAVFTLPKGISRIEEYFKTILQYLKEHGYEVVSAVVHLDETTPHLHADILNIKDHRLCRSEIWNRKSLIKLHEDVPKYLKERGFDVDRGSSLDKEAKKKAKRSIQQYKKDMMKSDIEQLEREKRQLLEGNEYIAYEIVNAVEIREYERCR